MHLTTVSIPRMATAGDTESKTETLGNIGLFMTGIANAWGTLLSLIALLFSR